MIYLKVYLVAGSLFSLYFFLSPYWSLSPFLNRKEGEPILSSPPLREWPVTIAFGWLTAVVFVIIWPIIAGYMIRGWLFPSPTLELAKEFKVTREDLVEHVSLDEVERREWVSDPLGAVPEVPFGHLNAAWQEYLKQVGEGAELWTYAARWTQWGHTFVRTGYVAVQENSVGPHFPVG